MIVYCNDEKCDYNEDGLCYAGSINIDGMCLTFREKVNEESEDNDERQHHPLQGL